ncbi:hypothetical protein BDN72DRAFT_835648 [Pluteus cervinus]|uniref:Uncharacterized protein n=1 Tax=Pluteus cervinus TaxID=181527 RepID=A0ACD3B4Q3_9AGAR|nr:hypothetical protein BDN72DRAFT_835648 [Pluteus cervinus]
MFDLQFSLGALEIGTIVSGVLFGITTSQAYVYCQKYPTDSIRLRTLVPVIWFLELFHAITTFEGFYEVSILNVGLRMSPIGYTLALLSSGTLISLVQAYFTYRIQVVTERRWLTCICWAFSALRFVGTTWLAALLFVVTLEDFSAKWTPLAITVWLIGAFADVIIATSLSVDLIRKRKEAIFGRRILDKIITTTIQTGLVTSFATIALVVCFIAMPDNLIWAAVGSSLPKMFSISLLSSLNARDSLSSGNRTDMSSMHFCRDRRDRGKRLLRWSRVDFQPSISTLDAERSPV